MSNYDNVKVQASLKAAELFLEHELRYMAIRTKHVAKRFQHAYEHANKHTHI